MSESDLREELCRVGASLYERGYEKDPAKVALEGLRAAERNKKDVLLVDTAGASFCLLTDSIQIPYLAPIPC